MWIFGEEQDKQNTLVSRLVAALAHVAEHGHLHAFALPPSEKQMLMRVAIVEGLFVWNEKFQKYELTTKGGERLAQYRQ